MSRTSSTDHSSPIKLDTLRLIKPETYINYYNLQVESTNFQYNLEASQEYLKHLQENLKLQPDDPDYLEKFKNLTNFLNHHVITEYIDSENLDNLRADHSISYFFIDLLTMTNDFRTCQSPFKSTKIQLNSFDSKIKH